MTKKLTLVDIKNQNKVYEQKQRIELSDEFHLFIYPHFSPTKISELIKEMVTDGQRATEAGIDFDKINMGDWFMFNVIYKFADLGIPSEIKKKVQAFTYLIDSDFFGKIVESFPQESIKKLEESFLRFQANFELLLKENGLITDENIDELLEKES
jgi:hypothetical protein